MQFIKTYLTYDVYDVILLSRIAKMQLSSISAVWQV